MLDLITTAYSVDDQNVTGGPTWLATDRFDVIAKSRSPASEETLKFSAQTGVRPMIERYPLEKAADGFDQMMSGRARFRVVLTM